ncbi:hypothetical protein BHE74_00041995 [Ensete ventricosum]|nr:hypothetical protein BHE74_00041995 [Ensete ventricosum]
MDYSSSRLTLSCHGPSCIRVTPIPTLDVSAPIINIWPRLGVDNIMVVRAIVPHDKGGASFFTVRGMMFLLRSANDPSLILISPLEGLNFLTVLGRRSMHKGVRQKKTETHWKIVGDSRKACLEKLTGNTARDHRKKTRRLTARMPEAVRLVGVNRSYPGIQAAEPPRSMGESPIPDFYEYV